MKISKRHNKIIAIFLFLISLICAFSYFKSLKETIKPNVILITLDALRADHLGCYGYLRKTSPNIDKLAEEGIVFLNCFATSSGTVYSCPGFMTGRYLEIDKDYVLFDNILDRKFITFAGYLKKAGYYTTAFINNRHLKIGKGFEQGFDIYEDSSIDAETMTDRVISFLNNYSGNKPLFIWIHYLDTHAPYSVPEEYANVFSSDKLYIENDKVLELSPKQNNNYTSLGYLPECVFRENHYSLNYYVALYDAAIRYTDLHIGRLLEKIENNSLIILSADHGESLGEHNHYFCHEENIYDELLHIPLIINGSRFFRGRKKISTVVSSIDMVPSILSRLNPIWYFFNKNKFNGKDLNRIVEGRDIKRKYIYSYWPWARSIRDVKKNVKYILNRRGEEELYFLPDEYNNRINDNSLDASCIRGELRLNLKKWLKDYPIRSDINSQKMFLGKDERQLLRNLGYLQ